MRVNPLTSAVIMPGAVSLIRGNQLDLPDDVAERLIAGGIVEPVGPTEPEAKKAPRTKKVSAAPENKAVSVDGDRGD